MGKTTETKKIYARVVFESQVEVTREAENEDTWDRDDTFTSWTIPTVFDLEKEEGYRTEPLSFEPTPGQTCFMVYAIWSTGDTFGHDEQACCEAFGIYGTFTEAEIRRKELQEPSEGRKDKYGYTIYLPWEGYFERLNVLKIIPITYIPNYA